MKYQQKQFTPELHKELQNTEEMLKIMLEKVVSGYKSVFAKKNLVLDAEFVREGTDPFTPGYNSSISIGIESEEEIDLHTIKIWECERYFLGLPTSRNLPGSKIIGELLDETLEEIKQEIKVYLNEMLETEEGDPNK